MSARAQETSLISAIYETIYPDLRCFQGFACLRVYCCTLYTHASTKISAQQLALLCAKIITSKMVDDSVSRSQYPATAHS